MTSGYTSNTTMTLDSEALEQTLKHTAKMIKDLRLDLVPPGGGEKLAWFPTAITMPEKGMIFPEPNKKTEVKKTFAKNKEGIMEEVDSTEKPDWGWTVVKAIPIPEEEQEKYPNPNEPGTFYKNRMDMKNMKRFDKLCFMDAAEELGMFEKPVVNED